jgi:hypothetical protein
MDFWKLTHFCFSIGLLLPLVLTGCGGSELSCIPHDVLVHIGGETDVVLSLRYVYLHIFILVHDVYCFSSAVLMIPWRSTLCTNLPVQQRR